MTHLEEQTWNTETILNTVSFAPLILPSGSTVGDMKAIAISKRDRETERERREEGRKKKSQPKSAYLSPSLLYRFYSFIT